MEIIKAQQLLNDKPFCLEQVMPLIYQKSLLIPQDVTHTIIHDSEQFYKQQPNEDNKIVLTTEIAYCKLSDIDINSLLADN